MKKEDLVVLCERGLTQRQMADSEGVSQTTIKYWLSKYGLKTNNVKRGGKIAEVRDCLHCGTGFKLGRQNKKKYCNSQCQSDYEWETKHVPKIERGEGGNVKRYLKEKRGDSCEVCGIGNVWNGKVLTLQLDHIDGDSDNDDIGNVRLICPNCHTQTDTFTSRNIKNSKRNRYLREYKSDKKQTRKSK